MLSRCGSEGGTHPSYETETEMIGQLPFDFRIESWLVYLGVATRMKRDHPVVVVVVGTAVDLVIAVLRVLIAVAAGW